MRIVELKCGTAFINRTSTSVSNDIVVNGKWYLHRNVIAEWTPNGILLCDCGWRTVTTKSRLNAILKMTGTALRISQSAHKWYIFNYQTGEREEWRGSYLIPAA